MRLRDYVYSATVLRCIDGDTVSLRIDLGFHTSLETHARLIGIDTPEKKLDTKEAGIEAQRHLEHLCFSYAIRRQDNRPVLLIQSHKSVYYDKYGRWLVELFGWDSDGNEVNINERMVNDGHAVLYSV